MPPTAAHEYAAATRMPAPHRRRMFCRRAPALDSMHTACSFSARQPRKHRTRGCPALTDQHPMVVYGPDEVHARLDYEGCIRAVRVAMARFSGEGTAQPLRNIVPVGPGRLFGVMPGALVSPDGFGAKLLAVYDDPTHPGRSRHRGVIVLFNRETGAVECIADAESVTAIRTAAASAVATEALARPDATVLAVLGCGTQAGTHIRALSRVRRLSAIRVWGRSEERARQFATRIGHDVPVPVQVCRDARAAVENADLICTVTGASSPILFGEWVRPGTHVNIVGSSHPGPVEIDSALLLRSRYVVDSRRSAMAAATEFLLAKKAGLIDEGHIAAEIGDVLNGHTPGRTAPEQVTLYKSLGHIVQDLAAVAYLHARGGAEEEEPASNS